jgi:hypothetical protein
LGWVNLHFHYTDQKGTRMFGRPYQTVASLSKDLVRLLRQTAVSDIWFCTSLQKKVSMRNGYPCAERKQVDALLLKALWLDVDVKPGKPDKGYETFDDAEKAIEAFYRKVGLPIPSVMVKSGGGAHVYWVLDRSLTREEWQPLADQLKAAVIQERLKADAFVTSDAARLLRVPETTNYKDGQQRPVSLWRADGPDYPKGALEKPLAVYAPRAHTASQLPGAFKGAKPDPRCAGMERPSAGIEREEIVLDTKPIMEGCAFLRDALNTGGKTYSEPMWHLTTLASVFLPESRELAHKMAKDHPEYDPATTDEKFARKEAFRDDGGGWPSCNEIQAAGSKACATCPHFGKIKGPLNLGLHKQASKADTPVEIGSFADPYAEFVGPPFPLDVLPPTFANFVVAQHRAMGADPSALAMAALTTVAGAIHAETVVRAGDGWWEKPILWTALIGAPSTMKTPIIDKTMKPLVLIDHHRDHIWREEYSQWQQRDRAAKRKKSNTDDPGPPPPRPPRCIIHDATPEKAAEILSRGPSGSLMVHDELAGWLGSFERYSAGASSRAFYLQCWNGGTFLKDRVGKGKHDLDAEIRVDNLALCILGGIQPDRLASLQDLTSDGLLQRFSSPVLMRPAERGDENYPVAQAEDDYARLIKSISELPSQKYHFQDDESEEEDAREAEFLRSL